MKTFRFRVGMRENCEGLDQKFEEWLRTSKFPDASGVAIITIQAESWNSFFAEYPHVICLDHMLCYDDFMAWLECQYDCRGIAIDCTRYTPRQLLEVAYKWPYGIVYDGPEPVPDPDAEDEDDNFNDDEGEKQPVQPVVESAGALPPETAQEVNSATSFDDIVNLFKRLFPDGFNAENGEKSVYERLVRGDFNQDDYRTFFNHVVQAYKEVNSNFDMMRDPVKQYLNLHEQEFGKRTVGDDEKQSSAS